MFDLPDQQNKDIGEFIEKTQLSVDDIPLEWMYMKCHNPPKVNLNANLVSDQCYKHFYNLAQLYQEPNTELKLTKEDVSKWFELNQIYQVFPWVYNCRFIFRVTRPNPKKCIDFHLDITEHTMQIFIVHENVIGADLTYIINEQLEVVPRVLGGYVIHDNKIVHGVSPQLSGLRVSLFLLSL